MRSRLCARYGLIALSAIGLLALPACQTREPDPIAVRRLAPVSTRCRPNRRRRASQERNPAAELAAVMAAHFKGLGHMERLRISPGGRSLPRRPPPRPGWIPGAINLAIALLNDSGVQAEQAKKAGGEPPISNFDEALDLLAGVLERDPENPYAHFCRGIILEQQGRLAEAHGHFKRVTEIDPNDAAAWYWSASTLTDPDDPSARGPRSSQRANRLVRQSPRTQPLPDARDL